MSALQMSSAEDSEGNLDTSLCEHLAGGKTATDGPQLSPTVDRGTEKYTREVPSTGGARGHVIWVLKLNLKKKCILG